MSDYLMLILVNLSLHEVTAGLHVGAAVEGGPGVHVRPPSVGVTPDDVSQLLSGLLERWIVYRRVVGFLIYN